MLPPRFKTPRFAVVCRKRQEAAAVTYRRGCSHAGSAGWHFISQPRLPAPSPGLAVSCPKDTHHRVSVTEPKSLRSCRLRSSLLRSPPLIKVPKDVLQSSRGDTVFYNHSRAVGQGSNFLLSLPARFPCLCPSSACSHLSSRRRRADLGTTSSPFSVSRASESPSLHHRSQTPRSCRTVRCCGLTYSACSRKSLCNTTALSPSSTLQEELLV